jgi:hypothetical protein
VPEKTFEQEKNKNWKLNENVEMDYLSPRLDYDVSLQPVVLAAAAGC